MKSPPSNLFDIAVGTCLNPDCSNVHISIFREKVLLANIPFEEGDCNNLLLAIAKAQETLKKKLGRRVHGWDCWGNEVDKFNGSQDPEV